MTTFPAVTIELDANERDHLRKAVTLYYSEVIGASARPGVMNPSDVTMKAAKTVFQKAKAACDVIDKA